MVFLLGIDKTNYSDDGTTNMWESNFLNDRNCNLRAKLLQPTTATAVTNINILFVFEFQVVDGKCGQCWELHCVRNQFTHFFSSPTLKKEIIKQVQLKWIYNYLILLFFLNNDSFNVIMKCWINVQQAWNNVHFIGISNHRLPAG